ncbi:GLUG motif-containing protein [uncultured Parabacteroides sp.]|uniref:GLUG motif-containing protein n=1 Tax=uncultured Parabacteroides sp. TaxID=512312 RepID=UPI0025E110A7|nr:GLUG motif-containing protein [uncultured Parabacteroides sp.]
MKKHLHLTPFRLLITIILCSLSKGILAQDTTTQTWEDLAQEPSGWTTASTEINISSEAELAWVAKMVNDDTDTGNAGQKGFEGVTITLTKDLDLIDHNWIPIGEKGKDYRFTRPFKGNFNGGDHTISNMKIVSDCSAGLFGQIDHTTIKNIKLINCFIEKSSNTYTSNKNIYAGCIAGASFSSTIENCHAEGTINYKGEASVYVGGITGKNASEDDTQAIINGCSFDGKFNYNLELTPSGGLKSGWAGGIAGTNNASSQTSGSITNCHAKIVAKVIQAEAGGITTSNRGVIKGCSAEGSINVTLDGTTSGVGGIVSENTKPLYSNPTYTIENCTSSCDITLVYKIKESLQSTGYYAKVGGITGTHNMGNAQKCPPITDCTTSGTISVELITDQPSSTDLSGNLCTAGGIAGYSKAAIQNCKSSAKVSATTKIPDTEAYAGGITGIFEQAPISNCVVSGTVTTNGVVSYGGGIAGQCSNAIKNSFSTANIISTGNNNTVGGIAGYNTHYIQNCYSTGDITSTGEINYAGGIAGYNKYEILNCYATGKVAANCTQITKANEDPRGYVGGITGINKGSRTNSKGSVVNCLALNTGGITYNATTPGRIVGFQDQTVATVTDNFAHPEIPKVDDAVVDNGADWDGSSYPFQSSDAWDFTDNTQLPKLKYIKEDGSYETTTIVNQPTIPIVSLQNYIITFDTPQHGTLTVTDQNQVSIQSNDKVKGGTTLTITATPEDDGYELKELLVNGTSFSSGNTLTVSEAIVIAASFGKKQTPEPPPEPEPTPDPDPTPTVYHIVTLPQIEGATTDPIAGEYEVEAWSSFRFYLTLDEGYNQSSPIVTTNRGETITPRSSDGAYIIKYVRQPITINIDGIVKNPDPVANEAINTNSTKVWTEEACLHIQTSQPETVFIHTFNGSLLKKLDKLSGNKTVWLPQGNYIVLIGKERFKVQVK